MPCAIRQDHAKRPLQISCRDPKNGRPRRIHCSGIERRLIGANPDVDHRRAGLQPTGASPFRDNQCDELLPGEVSYGQRCSLSASLRRREPGDRCGLSEISVGVGAERSRRKMHAVNSQNCRSASSAGTSLVSNWSSGRRRDDETAICDARTSEEAISAYKLENGFVPQA